MAEENESWDAVTPDRIGIPLDVLDNIITDLNSNADLKKIFGDPVAKGLIIVAQKEDNGEIDLRIEDAVGVSEEQTQTFVEILDSIIKANSI